MRKNEIEALRNSVLFEKLTEDDFTGLLKKLPSSTEEFSSGCMIYSPSDFRKCLGIIVKGSAVVSKESGMLMSILSPGDVFGIPVLFSDKPFPTLVTAKENCRVCFIEKELFIEMMAGSRALAENYLSLLSNRIVYLNEKIARISAPTPADKLKSYLESTADRLNSQEFVLPVSLSGLASALSLGRTSLYRAFDELTEAGYLEKNGKAIKLIR